MKERGIATETHVPPPAWNAPIPMPCVRVHRPRPGYAHPATKADIEQLLRFLGAECTYGVRRIELARGHVAPSGAVLFGRLVQPGIIRIFDQPPSPWMLPGTLPHSEARRLTEAEAILEAGAGYVTVTWPGDTLREFMLFDVLLHEIGHHILQFHKGKRRARVARSQDHEAHAARFVRRRREMVYGDRAS